MIFLVAAIPMFYVGNAAKEEISRKVAKNLTMADASKLQ